MAQVAERMEKLQGVERSEYASDKEFFERLEARAVDLDIPEMGGLKVRIKPLNIEERDKALRASKGTSGDLDNAMFQAMTLVLGLDRPRLAIDSIPKLKAANPKALDRIAKEIWKLSGLAEQAELIKNA